MRFHRLCVLVALGISASGCAATSTVSYGARHLVRTRAERAARPNWLVELPAPGTGTLAVVMTGDGGWPGFGGDVGRAIHADGVPTVGWDALLYFWHARTPEQASADLARVIRTYSARWHTDRVALVGYSRGADALPAMARLLPDDVRAQVGALVLLGPGTQAEFVFHIGDFFGRRSAGRSVGADVEALAGTPVLCLYGEQEAEPLCPALPPGAATVIGVPGRHHFEGSAPMVVRRVVATVAAVAETAVTEAPRR